MSDTFTIRNTVQQGDALSLLLFSFLLGWAITKVQVDMGKVKLKETQEIMEYAEDVNLLAGNVNGMQKHRGDVIIATRIIQP